MKLRNLSCSSPVFSVVSTLEEIPSSGRNSSRKRIGVPPPKLMKKMKSEEKEIISLDDLKPSTEAKGKLVLGEKQEGNVNEDDLCSVENKSR